MKEIIHMLKSLEIELEEKKENCGDLDVESHEFKRIKHKKNEILYRINLIQHAIFTLEHYQDLDSTSK